MAIAINGSNPGNSPIFPLPLLRCRQPTLRPVVDTKRSVLCLSLGAIVTSPAVSYTAAPVRWGSNPSLQPPARPPHRKVYGARLAPLVNTALRVSTEQHCGCRGGMGGFRPSKPLHLPVPMPTATTKVKMEALHFCMQSLFSRPAGPMRMILPQHKLLHSAFYQFLCPT